VDAQGFGPRVPMLVISPFAKKNYISHVQMDDVSILRFIQTTFGLAPLNARNQLGSDINDMFQF
jgi:phospholipase C